MPVKIPKLADRDSAKQPAIQPLDKHWYMQHAPLRLLEKASEAFAQKGFRGASFREIADMAGLSFQLIGYHFGTKEELWKACVNYLASQTLYAMFAAASEVRTLPTAATAEWIKKWMRTGLLFSIENPQFRQIITHECFPTSRRFQQFMLPKLEEHDVFMRGAFELASNQGVIDHVSHVEAMFLFRCIVIADVCMPYEMELAAGLSIADPRFLESQLDLLMSIFQRGRGIGLKGSAPIPAARKTASTAAPEKMRTATQAVLSDGRRLRGEALRKRLLGAAINRFGTDGFEGASLRAIAKEAGASYTLVNYHFGSKETLWEAAFTDLFDRGISKLKSSKFDLTKDVRNQLAAWFRQAIAISFKEPALRRIVTQEYFENSRRLAQFLRPKIEEYSAVLTEVFRPLIESKIITRFSLAEVLLVFRSVRLVNALHSEEMMAFLELKPDAGETFIEWQVNFLLDLFLGRPARPNKRAKSPRRPAGPRD